jgi:hypothetical protein
MNKTLIAAVAAATTMTVALADVTLSGTYEGTFAEGTTDGATYTQDLDLTLIGTAGQDTTVTATFEDITGGDTVTNTQLFIETKVMGLNLKGGTYKTQNGTGLMQKKSSAAGQFELSTAIQGIGVSVGQVSGSSKATADLATSINGVGITVQNITNTDRFISAVTDIAGLSVAFEQQTTTTGTNTAGSISTYIPLDETNTISLTGVMIDVEDTAGITQDDGILGDISDAQNGKTILGVVTSIDSTFGTVTSKYINKNDLDTYVIELNQGVMDYSYTKTENADGIFGAEISVTF